ncbi:hypothetical protein FB567DRAFT_583482 [Paraphoma chrysanthemicola]|uniref:Uncharacterized protein n=1 Tax=Paraphoma chrysanthemicola TaxID=798071 RepID=A0A8K0QW90_9PLEO|nr:hypothetical protein FB567DRAFT_583482 [Paraphoma chrysanthemicola]
MRGIMNWLFYAAWIVTLAVAVPITDSGNAGDVILQPLGLSSRDTCIGETSARQVARDSKDEETGDILHLTLPTPLDPSNTTNPSVPPTDSLQIFYNKYGSAYRWYMFQGPRGIAVNPCGDTRFKMIVQAVPDIHNPPSFENPPFPSRGYRWNVQIPPLTDCRYESDPKGESAGQLRCAGLIYDFLPDPGRGEPAILCQEGGFKRAWYVEY